MLIFFNGQKILTVLCEREYQNDQKAYENSMLKIVTFLGNGYKTMVRYHYMSSRMAKILKCDNIKCW